jgi:hypothetical protein
MQRVDSLPHASRARRLRGPLVVIAVWVMGHGSWDRDRGFCGLFEGSQPHLATLTLVGVTRHEYKNSLATLGLDRCVSACADVAAHACSWYLQLPLPAG